MKSTVRSLCGRRLHVHAHVLVVILIQGDGNYLLQLHSADASNTHIFTLYFLDSHNYAPEPDIQVWLWDYIKDSQIEWYREQSQSIKMIQRPFRVPRHEDSSKSGEGTSALKKPNAMAIFHMPLREFYDARPDTGQNGEALVVGSQHEKWGGPKQGQFFTRGLLKETESGPVIGEEDSTHQADAIKKAKPEVKVILNGELHFESNRVSSVSPGGTQVTAITRIAADASKVSGVASPAAAHIAGTPSMASTAVSGSISYQIMEKPYPHTRWALLVSYCRRCFG